jgi:hypothetical protein
MENFPKETEALKNCLATNNSRTGGVTNPSPSGGRNVEHDAYPSQSPWSQKPNSPLN